MQSADNRSVLRLLIALVLVTSGLAIYAALHFESTLPAPLLAFVHSQDNAEIAASQEIAATLTLLLFALALVGMAGLWWCRRWGRWAFTVAALASPIAAVLQAMADPTTSILNPIAMGANSASDMSIGAILILIWFGMGADFDERAGSGSRGAA